MCKRGDLNARSQGKVSVRNENEIMIAATVSLELVFKTHAARSLAGANLGFTKLIDGWLAWRSSQKSKLGQLFEFTECNEWPQEVISVRSRKKDISELLAGIV